MAAIQIPNNEWEDSVVKRNKFERSYGETAANTSATSGSSGDAKMTTALLDSWAAAKG